MNVKEAAERLQIPVTMLRWCLQEDAKHRGDRRYEPYCPYGIATRREKTWEYVIFPEKLELYLHPSETAKTVEKLAVTVEKLTAELNKTAKLLRGAINE